MNLTPNFSLEEMIFSQTAARYGIDNNPSEAVIKNLTRTCWLLERVRDLIDMPLIVSSGYRAPDVNKLAGSTNPHSQHVYGCAADFHSSKIPVDDIVIAIKESDLPFDQLIKEWNSWVHISVPTHPDSTPRRQVLIIDKAGTRPYA